MRPKPLPGGIRQPPAGPRRGALSPLELPPLLLTPHFPNTTSRLGESKRFPSSTFGLVLGSFLKVFKQISQKAETLKIMLSLQRECFPAKFKTWKNYYFLHPFLQAFSILLFFTLFIDLGSHLGFILGALGPLLACFFQYFWRPNLKMRKYWKNEAQTLSNINLS